MKNEKEKHQADIMTIQGRLKAALREKEYAETHQKVETHRITVQVPYERCSSCDQTALRKTKSDYDRAWKRLESEFKQRTVLYESTFLGCIVYAFLITIFMAIRTQNFISDVAEFLCGIGEGIVTIINGIFYAGKVVATLSNGIANTITSTMVYWFLLVLTMVVLLVGILALIWIGMRWIDNIYKKYCWDRISLIVIIVNIALFIFFGDWVKQLMKINQVVLLLVFHGIYMAIRWYVKGWREARGYY